MKQTLSSSSLLLFWLDWVRKLVIFPSGVNICLWFHPLRPHRPWTELPRSYAEFNTKLAKHLHKTAGKTYFLIWSKLGWFIQIVTPQHYVLLGWPCQILGYFKSRDWIMSNEVLSSLRFWLTDIPFPHWLITWKIESMTKLLIDDLYTWYVLSHTWSMLVINGSVAALCTLSQLTFQICKNCWADCLDW